MYPWKRPQIGYPIPTVQPQNFMCTIIQSEQFVFMYFGVCVYVSVSVCVCITTMKEIEAINLRGIGKEGGKKKVKMLQLYFNFIK